MKRRGHSDFRAAMAFLLPNFIGFLIFTAGPVVFSLGASFTNWDLQHSRPLAFTGTQNLQKLWGDHLFWIYLANTIYMLIGIPFAIAGALLLALLLSRQLRGISVYRTLFYLPSFCSGVALMLLWKQLYNPEFGPINRVIETMLRLFHLDAMYQPTAWLQSVKNLVGLDVEAVRFLPGNFGVGAKDAIVIMGVWTAIGGNNMLLYLAALTNIPPELYEAADIDGATAWRKFWHVTWPQLAPTTFFIIVMSFIGGLQGGFEQARIMTKGGPAGATTTLAYYIYTKAFEEFQMGYASTIAWVLFAMIFAITLCNWKFGRGVEQ